MSQTVAPPGYVPRGADLTELRRASAAAHGLERERRIRRLVTIGGGWAVAGMMTVRRCRMPCRDVDSPIAAGSLLRGDDARRWHL